MIVPRCYASNAMQVAQTFMRSPLSRHVSATIGVLMAVLASQCGLALTWSKTMAILGSLAALSREELEAMVLSMKVQAQRKLTLKVSAKGAVSLYGMGRFPVTLYAAQWDKVLGEGDTIRAFITANQDVLSSGKDDSRFAKADAND